MGNLNIMAPEKKIITKTVKPAPAKKAEKVAGPC
jgi:hypothetical protein